MKIMGLLLGVLLLGFDSIDGGPAQERPPVLVTVVRLQKFRNTGHHPENNRRVTFRLVNQSRTPLVVFGFKYDGGFEPTGYIITFDANRGEWVYPTNDNHPVNWSDTAREFKETLVLSPGKSITFTAEMSQLEVGGRFRRTVYIASEKSKEPAEVRSEQFVLK